MDKIISWLNNRYLIAAVVGLFLLGVIKTFRR
jgi:hypothetical protein